MSDRLRYYLAAIVMGFIVRIFFQPFGLTREKFGEIRTGIVAGRSLEETRRAVQ